MHHHHTGPPCAPTRRPWSRPGGSRPDLLIAGVVLVASCAIALLTPTRPDTAHHAPARQLVPVAAYRPLEHGGGSAEPGLPSQQDAQVTAGTAALPGAGDQPIGAADLEVLHKVKQAGLWEMPVGTWASRRAVTPRVREVGGMIAAEHTELDGIVTAAAARLGVALPTEPSSEQQAWMRDIDGRRGAAFDQRAVFLLRQAHGTVLPVLAQVRAGTRNAVIRQFTTDAMAFVQRHIQYLESTGLVSFDQLPDPSDLGPADDWLAHALDFAVFALVTAALCALLLAGGNALVARVKRRTRTRRPTTVRQHARSY
jgi:predicted outer membrane protein